ncbi:hypothetical protein EDD86DRAFT_188831 [Gorgonomyces haynaldii]|nr:hypothetical protein EDD86DRAFT_188831 [Gorgonomyces haynaldii]
MHPLKFKQEFIKLDQQPITVAGRIIAKREAGKKLLFLDICREQHKMQVVLRKTLFKDDQVFDALRDSKVGDVMVFEGIPGTTKAGEQSLMAHSGSVLAPCLRILPDKLEDEDLRYRDRSLDMIVNDRVLGTLKKRSQIIQCLRSSLLQRGFIEMETPVLSAQAGGANAKPFVTRMHALDTDLQLRIAPELYLKQLIIGGMEKVFEIGKQFRNEGIDPMHNPEFTTCEFYETYSNLESNMNMTQDLLRYIVQETHGSLQVEYQDHHIDFSQDFKIIDIQEALKAQLGALPDLNDPASIPKLLKIAKTRVSLPHTLPRVIDHLIGTYIEPHLIQPTFLTGHPECMSPLSKTSHGIARRYELFICGKEYINAYEELNDPQEQRRRFQMQQSDKQAGDEEAQPLDEHFCQALELGMPPTVGWGLGIDRLVMLLTNQQRIREVIPFPVLKPVKHD